MRWLPFVCALTLTVAGCANPGPTPPSAVTVGRDAKALLTGLGDFGIVQQSFEADPSQVVGTGWLHVTARFFDPEGARWLLHRGVNPDQAFDGRRPIHATANTAGANVEVAELLWLYGAELNPSTAGPELYGGATPLHWAAMYHQVELVSMLLERGADPNMLLNGSTPLAMLCRSGSSQEDRFKALSGARLLVEAGADINVANLPSHFPAIHGAAGSGGMPDVVVFLLDNGADPNLGCPLAAAANSGQLESARSLLAAGASPDCRDQHDDPVLIIAIRGGQHDIVRDLVAAGANVSVHKRPSEPWNDTTPLVTAARELDAELLALLLVSGAGLDDTVSMGTPLHYATRAASRVCRQGGDLTCEEAGAVVIQLIDAGADPNLVDGSGDTPLDDAEHEGLERLLRAHGAKTADEVPIAERRLRIKKLEAEKVPGPATPRGLGR